MVGPGGSELKSPSRSLFANVPVKLIAVILCAVLIPSVLITALGLMEVLEANTFVRSSFARPVRENLGELSNHLSETWEKRLRAYATYFQAGTSPDSQNPRDRRRSNKEIERRLPYMVKFRQNEPAVREVLVRIAGKLTAVDPFMPRRLGSQAPSEELAKLHRLELVDKDPRRALAEAERLVKGSDRDEVLVEAALAAARLNYHENSKARAIEHLRWAHERFGQTADHFGIVRAVPILVRIAEIEQSRGSRLPLGIAVREASDALRRYARFMPKEAVKFFDDRLDAILPENASRRKESAAGRGRRGPAFAGANLESLRSVLQATLSPTPGSLWQRVRIVDAKRGDLDFVGFGVRGEAPDVFVLLDRSFFLSEAREYCETFGLSPEGLALTLRGVPSADSEEEDTSFSLAAPEPFDSYQFLYTPPPGSLTPRFRGFSVVPLAAFTWSVIILVLTIIVAVLFTLRYTLRELETARLKTDFVSFVTHELKTPLTSIRMYAETVLDGRVDDESDRATCLRMIDQESQRLSKLIDQVLEYSRIEKHQKKFRFTSCSMVDVVRETLKIFHDHNRENPRVVEVNAAQHISKTRVDKASMIELLLNLLTNAAKYSPPDTRITVNVRESVSEISVEVIDRGVGIRKRDQKRIFDRFYRAEDYLTRDVDGTGLGLTFSRYIAKVHNGEIRVSSQLGGGSSFTLVLRKTHVLAE